MKLRPIALTAALGLSAAFVAAPSFAADAAAKPGYTKERADCEAGRTAQDRATCLKEAGAAQDERRRNGLVNAGSAPQNAVDRCKALPSKDQADCMARIDGPGKPNQTTTTSGSVTGGGIIRETKTVTPGATVVIPAPAPATPPPTPAPKP